MRVIFIGSGQLACPALDSLLHSRQDETVGVVCQPDRPRGRNQKTGSCPAKTHAERLGLVALTPEKIGDPLAYEVLKELKPDLLVVADYGQYIPSRIVQLPSRGAINIHPSLLPRYRGASPIQWAIANGEKVTGVTVLYVGKEMDAGDIIRQEELAIEDEDTLVTLEPRLATLGARMLNQVLDGFQSGPVAGVPQDESKATVVHKLNKEDGRIDWALPAETVRNRIRGFNPWPCCFCEVTKGTGHFLKILKGKVEYLSGKAGEVISCDGDGPVVATGAGALRLLEVQPESGKPMTGRAYLNGHPLRAGDVLG